MIVNGTALAENVYAALARTVAQMERSPHLTVITCAPSFATEKYIGLKRRKAADVGIRVNVIELPETLTTSDMVAVVMRAAPHTDGIIVQLPLPAHIETDAVLAAIPPALDVDGMQYGMRGEGHLPPVVAAMEEIVVHERLSLIGASVVVVGHGRLVGQPAAVWAVAKGGVVTVLDKDSTNQAAAIAAADVLILGTGVAGLITPAMIKEGVVIFDAGTSEVGGELRGDADPGCAAKAALLTPVPGGIGPLTVAALLRNVVHAAD